MKVKWTEIQKYGAGNATFVNHESDADWVKLGPGNTLCYAWNEGTRVSVVTYTQMELIALPGYQVRCGRDYMYYESEANV